MAGVAQRDSRSLERLFDRYAGTLLAIARRVLGNHQDAEDVVAQVFWEIWHRSARYDASRSSPRTYLFMVTRSRALDLLRRGETRAVLHQNALLAASDISAFGSDPLEPLVQLSLEEERRSVREAMSSLSQFERQALELAYFNGLTHRQIAAELDLPLGTIKGRIRAAMQKLHSALRRIGEKA